MDWGMALSAFGTLITVGSAVYAYMTNREKKNLQNLIRANLRSLAGDIERITASASWAHHHLQEAHKQALTLERSDTSNEILNCVFYGKADALSAERMVKNLLNDVLSMQEGLFGTRIVTHPDLPRTDSAK